MNLQDIMDKLVAAGFENCHVSDGCQIIVNNRGEIDLDSNGEATIFDRLTPGYGNHRPTSDLDQLLTTVQVTWSKKEPT